MSDHAPITMNAAYIDRLGGPEQIRYGTRRVPSPEADEILIRAEAMGVNHVDTFVRSGAYRTDLPMPLIIGRDVVGTVQSVGDAVEDHQVGDRVWCNSLGYDGRQGSFAEYVLAPAGRAYPLPDAVDAVEAVSVLHTMATAYLGLLREAQVGAGETVFVGGAGGGVGSCAVQLAVSRGATVIASAAPDDFDWVRSCGASDLIDYHDDNGLAALHDLAPSGVDVHWDTSGHADLAEAMALVSPGGRMLLSAGMSNRVELTAGEMYTRDVSLHGFAMSNASITDLAAAAEVVGGLLAGPGVRTRVGRVLPLAEAREAHRLLEQESTRSLGGRLVVVPEVS